MARACESLISQQTPDLTEALGLLGRTAGASRAHLWECRDGGRLWVNTHEWCARGTKRLIDRRRLLDAAAVAPCWKAQLEAGETIYVPDVEGLPPEASAEKRAGKEWGIRSALNVPILSSQHELLGFVGFHNTVRSNRRRVADDTWVLRAFAGMVAAYWTRGKARHEAWLASERFRLLAEHSMDPFLVVNAEKILTYVSPSAREVLGHDPEEAIGKPAGSFIHPRDVRRWCRDFARCVSEPRSHITTEGRVRHKDGSWRVIEARMVNLMDAKPVSGVASHFRDVTELRRLERELLTICTREREDLRRDLHDSVGGYFTALHIRAQALAKKVAAGKALRPDEVSEITSIVEQARDTAHAISMAVCPVPSQPDGLARALRQLAAMTRLIARRRVRFRCPSPILLSDGPAALQAYRIAQEAVNNAIRHGGATDVVIELRKKDGVVELSVRDNGKGFDPALTRSSGMGISIMRCRAHLLRGSLDIGPAPRGGTIVTLSFTPSDENG